MKSVNVEMPEIEVVCRVYDVYSAEYYAYVSENEDGDLVWYNEADDEVIENIAMWKAL
jgi:hypothetical protein